ncbi:MAG: hypothetical protein Q9170_002207 [Blastenia crenularia]
MAPEEPSEPESIHTWKEIDTVYPFGQQSRGSEPAFRLSLHQAETPCYGILLAGLYPKAISVCLSASNSIKILRAIRSDDGNYRFHEMLQVNAIASVINDISWAPGSIRPHDLIAAACDDGCVRLYTVTVLTKSHSPSTNAGSFEESPSRDRHSSSHVHRQALSGIGAGLAGFSRGETARRPDGEYAYIESPTYRSRHYEKMYSKGRISSLCRDDILTSRGANPRTGVISPCILGGSSEASEGSDYVLIGWQQQERQPTVCVDERWKQDDLGWSLVECASGYPESNAVAIKSSDPGIASIAPEPISANPARARDLTSPPISNKAIEDCGKTYNGSLEDSVEDHMGEITQDIWRNSIPPSADRRLLLESHFRIPRKAVGSGRGSSNIQPDRSLREGLMSELSRYNATPRDKASRPFLPVFPDIIAIGHHAYPSTPSGDRDHHFDRKLTSQTKRRYGSLGVREIHPIYQGSQPRDQHASLVHPPKAPINPNLENTYRRPKVLLPARLRGYSTHHSEYRSASPKSTSRESVVDQRPNIKRLLATTAVPVANWFKQLANAECQNTRTSLAETHVRMASGQQEDRVREEVCPASTLDGIDASTCAARKAFRNISASKTCPETLKKPPLVSPVQQQTLLSRRGPRNPIGRAIFSHQQTPEKQRRIRDLTRPADGTPTAAGKHSPGRVGTIVRRKDTPEVFDSLLAILRELTSLVHFGYLHERLSKRTRQAVLTFHHAPEAIRTLRSQNANVWDYLSAIRHIVVATAYMVVLLSVVAAILKALKVFIDIAMCIWYPLGLLLKMVRWIVLD